MKKALLWSLILCLLLCLSGCIRTETIYTCMYSTDEITEIAIFDFGDVGAYEIMDGSTPVTYVEPEQWDSFVADLQGLPFEQMMILLPVAADPNFLHTGYTVRITYNGGAYEVISSQGVQSRHYADGRGQTMHYSCADAPWDAFVQTYIFDN